MTSLAQKVVDVHRALDRARVPHAFGGALALAYYAEPRATADIDLNVFVPAEEHVAALEALARTGVTLEHDTGDRVVRDGQARVHWDRTPIDLFFAYHGLHRAMQRSVRSQPFLDDSLPFLAPQHLAVCKVVFDRAKDWLDLAQIVTTVDDLDVTEVERWVVGLVGEQDRRVERWRTLLADLRP